VEPVPHTAAEVDVDGLGGMVGHNDVLVKTVVVGVGGCDVTCGGPRRKQVIVKLNRMLCMHCGVAVAVIITKGLLYVSS
jgi:hypothetical protein